MEKKNDLNELFTTVNNNKWCFFFAVCTSMILMTVYLFVIATPVYQSTTQILVNQTENNEAVIQAQNVQANLDLINTYNVIIKSPRILNTVKKNLKNDYSEGELVKAIQVSNAANSQVIEIKVESTDPQEAVAIANETAQVFKKEIVQIMKVNNVDILSSADNKKNVKPVKPRKIIMLTLSFFLGILIGVMIILIRTLFDRTLKNKEEISQVFKLQLLGSVYDINGSEKSNRKVKHAKKSLKTRENNESKLITIRDKSSLISEQFKIIQTGIDFSGVNQSYRTIVITSPEAGSGKSTVAANLAVVYAQKGKKTLLIDGDMRKPTVHITFNKKNFLGLSTALTEKVKLSDICQITDIKGLSIITSGIIPPNPTDLLNSKRMEKLLKILQKYFDVILIDSPPVTVVSDTLALAARSDGVLLVVRNKFTQKEKCNQAIEQIKLVKKPIIGAVFNGETKRSDEKYYYQ
ncbi:polysaccharide biosynthesis tyrosine autokinase [Carnobacterium maltaromaticum]|uniref:polysaccharide biosynthesis tyrosine autokinase n=1 Tax=Carnobacterium maltaromaticum TaxID=2751 RepID=UPI001E59C336|nr:polysaccharide biosynthesis tyrosine autokinase [Carnobacterium maltaromaticum]